MEMEMVSFIVVFALFAAGGWYEESRHAARCERKLVKLMEHLDAEGRGQEALEVVSRA